LFPLFATVIVDTGGNLPSVLLTPVANLAPVYVVDTGDKVAAAIVDTGGAP
jgi:hypothetical protein